MALFLIYDRDNAHADPVKEARGCYKRGDIVEVLDDSKHDGDLVKNPISPPFYLVRVTGVTKEQAEKYMVSHVEPRPATRTWNKKRWEEAQKTGQFEEFVSVPVLVAGSAFDKTIQITVALGDYNDMVERGDYGDYYYPPATSKPYVWHHPDVPLIIEVRIDLTGIVSYVDLTGDVPTTLRRRLHNVEVANIPSAIRNKLLADRYVSVSWSQVRNYIRNRMTNSTAGATP